MSDDNKKLPAGWEMKKLGEVCAVVAGQSPEGKYYNNKATGLPFYQGKKEFSEKYLGAPTTWTTVVTSEACLNDILMSVRAPVGPVNIATEKICIGRGLAAIRALNLIDREYLFNFLIKHESEIIGNAGAVFSSINKNQIEAIKIPLPPLPEQKRIVAILDESIRAIAEAKENAEKNLANARELFAGYLNDIFSNPGNDWEEKKLDEVCIVERGSSPRPIKEYFTTKSDGVNWIKIGDTEEGGKYVYSTAQKITKKGAEQSRYVKEGDFILTNSMSLGRPYIMKTDGYIHDGWFVLRLNHDIDTEYFYYLLSSKYVQNQFGQLAAGAIVKNISGDLVKKTNVRIPRMSQQKKYVQEVIALSAETKRLESIYQKKLAALDELKKSILQKAFSGEL